MTEHKEINREGIELLQLVSFMLGNEEYGINIHNVHEINRMLPITQVPNSPYFVSGVINLRGKVIPVINLRNKLGMERKEEDKATRIIVLELEDKTIGFIVDSVKEVIRIPENITEAPPEMTSSGNSEFIKSVAKLDDRLLILLDMNKIIIN